VQASRVMLEEVESFGLDWEKGRGEKKKDLSERQEEEHECEICEI